ncbi:hypothetical protein OK016_19440 [Vibrio chagasii]|nr:hypothetical protein [Vibrio chagasii]
MGERPNSSNVTTINDDSDVTTVVYADALGVTEGGCWAKHHLHGDDVTGTRGPADGAVTVTPSNGATITIADGATSGTTMFQQVMMYT